MRLLPRILAGLILVGLAPGAGWAGSSRGPINKVYIVQGFQVVTIKVLLRPRPSAVVNVLGDGDTNLDLVVLDSQGHRVGVDARPTDRCTVRWPPRAREPYTVKIYNRGGVPNRFQLRID